jgi:hypothetical protein
MKCEADCSRDRERQPKRSDDQPGHHESEIVLPEAEAEKRHDEARCQRPRADRKAEYARRQPRQDASFLLLTMGGRSSFSPVSIDGREVSLTLQGHTITRWSKQPCLRWVVR